MANLWLFVDLEDGRIIVYVVVENADDGNGNALGLTAALDDDERVEPNRVLVDDGQDRHEPLALAAFDDDDGVPIVVKQLLHARQHGGRPSQLLHQLALFL
jgi:hypothetical protein